MNEGITIGQDLTNDIFAGIDDNAREDFLTILAGAKSNLIAIEQEDD